MSNTAYLKRIEDDEGHAEELLPPGNEEPVEYTQHHVVWQGLHVGEQRHEPPARMRCEQESSDPVKAAVHHSPSRDHADRELEFLEVPRDLGQVHGHKSLQLLRIHPSVHKANATISVERGKHTWKQRKVSRGSPGPKSRSSS